MQNATKKTLLQILFSLFLIKDMIRFQQLILSITLYYCRTHLSSVNLWSRFISFDLSTQCQPVSQWETVVSWTDRWVYPGIKGKDSFWKWQPVLTKQWRVWENIETAWRSWMSVLCLETVFTTTTKLFGGICNRAARCSLFSLCQLVHHFGADWNTSTTVGQIPMIHFVQTFPRASEDES